MVAQTQGPLGEYLLKHRPLTNVLHSQNPISGESQRRLLVILLQCQHRGFYGIRAEYTHLHPNGRNSASAREKALHCKFGGTVQSNTGMGANAANDAILMICP